MSAPKYTPGRSVTDCAICDKPLDGHDHNLRCSNCRGPLGAPASIRRGLCTACVERLPKAAPALAAALERVFMLHAPGYCQDDEHRESCEWCKARKALVAAGRLSP